MACNNYKTKQKNIIIKNVESVLIINLPQTVNYRNNLMEKKLVYSNNSKIHTSYSNISFCLVLFYTLINKQLESFTK